MISLRPLRSIRMRLALWYAFALAVALLGYAVFIQVAAWRMLSEDIDRQLDQDVQLAQSMLDERHGLLIWQDDEEDRLAKSNDTPERQAEEAAAIPLIEVYDKQGKLLFRNPKYKKVSESTHRILRRHTDIEGFHDLIVYAARPTRPMQRELMSLAIVMGLGIPLVTLLAGAGGYLLARRALAPVDSMVERARKISAERLSERLPIENPDDELGQLAIIFNETFARLERSFEQLRRFTADASHELRTPLTSIRSVGEVGLRERRTNEEYREVIGSMLEESDRLSRLVSGLLTLSRADGGQMKLKREPLDLTRLAGEVVQQMHVLAEEKSQTVSLDAPESLPIQADPLILRQALVNLLDNAIKYSPGESEIMVAAKLREGKICIEVRDQGPGIPAEHHAHVFDRFYRIDTARSREMGGAGLGLSIVRWAVEAHGGRIELESEPGKGSLFRIVLPA